jgi:hypothetical protein
VLLRQVSRLIRDPHGPRDRQSRPKGRTASELAADLMFKGRAISLPTRSTCLATGVTRAIADTGPIVVETVSALYTKRAAKHGELGAKTGAIAVSRRSADLGRAIRRVRRGRRHRAPLRDHKA